MPYPPQLEYDTERAGGLEPLQYLPPGKHAVLGLVTTKSGAVSATTYPIHIHSGARELSNLIGAARGLGDD